MGNLVKLCYKGHIRVLHLTVNELPFGGRNRNNPEQDRTYDLLHYIPVLYQCAISSFLWFHIKYNTWCGWWLQLEESLQRWNSQRKKVHRLAYGFSIDFKIYRLAYGLLSVNHKGLAKIYRFLLRAFFSQVLKIHRGVWIFLWIFGCYGSVSSMFHFDLYKYSLY